MSEFLQNLLKKVKDSADALEAPPAPPGLETRSTPDLRSKQKKKSKPGLPRKPSSPPQPDSEFGLTVKPALAPKPSSATVPGLPPKPDLVPKPDSRRHIEHESDLPTEPRLPVEPLPFQLLRTFTTSREAITTLMPEMKDSELRLYHYLAELTYGNPRRLTDQVITYSQKHAMKAASIKSTATIVKSMNSLCKKKLVKWIRKARKRGEVSQLKVFLPGDVQDSRMRSDPPTVE